MEGLGVRTLLIRLSLVVAVVAVCAWPVQAQRSNERRGELDTAAECVSIDVSGLGSAVADVTGTWAGTLSFYVEGGGGTRNAVDVAKADTPSTFVNTTTANGEWKADVAGYKAFVVCMTSFTSGTARVDLTAAGTGGGSGGGGGGGGEVTNAGTFATQESGTLLTEVQSISHAEDSAHSSGHVGVQVLAVRQDSQVDFAADGDYVPLSINDAGELRVAFAGAAGGTSLADDADFSAGTTPFTPVGGFYQSSVTACTDGDTCAVGITAQRAIKATLYSEAGAALTPATDATEDSAAPETGPLIQAEFDDASTNTVDEDDAGKLRIDANRILYTRQIDPCSGSGTKLYLPFDITTATTTEITPSLAGSSTHYYICALNIVTQAANSVNLVDDNSDNCDSVTASLISSGLAATDGWYFAANGGITIGNGAGSIMRTQTSNSVLCLVTSAATELHGQFVVVAAP
jgi:hypothetical protein